MRILQILDSDLIKKNVLNPNSILISALNLILLSK